MCVCVVLFRFVSCYRHVLWGHYALHRCVHSRSQGPLNDAAHRACTLLYSRLSPGSGPTSGWLPTPGPTLGWLRVGPTFGVRIGPSLRRAARDKPMRSAEAAEAAVAYKYKQNRVCRNFFLSECVTNAASDPPDSTMCPQVLHRRVIQ